MFVEKEKFFCQREVEKGKSKHIMHGAELHPEQQLKLQIPPCKSDNHSKDSLSFPLFSFLFPPQTSQDNVLPSL
jgi:hypothetical protein